MSIVIALEMLDALPDNVEVVFTNDKEVGQTGAEEYLASMRNDLRPCIALDACSDFDAGYLDPKNCKEAEGFPGYKKGQHAIE